MVDGECVYCGEDPVIAKDYLVCKGCAEKKQRAPYPWCSKPLECSETGRCARNPNCGE